MTDTTKLYDKQEIFEMVTYVNYLIHLAMTGDLEGLKLNLVDKPVTMDHLSTLLERAVGEGHVHCLGYLTDTLIQTHEASLKEAQNDNHIKTIQRLNTVFPRTLSKAFSVGCEAGQLGCLQFLQKNYSKYIDIHTVYDTSYSSHLKLPREHALVNNLTLAASLSHNEVVYYLLEGQKDMGLPSFDIHFENAAVLFHALFEENTALQDYLVFESNIVLQAGEYEDIRDKLKPYGKLSQLDNFMTQLQKRDLFYDIDSKVGSKPESRNVRNKI